MQTLMLYICKYIHIYKYLLYVYSKRQTMCPPGCYQFANDLIVTNAPFTWAHHV